MSFASAEVILLTEIGPPLAPAAQRDIPRKNGKKVKDLMPPGWQVGDNPRDIDIVNVHVLNVRGHEDGAHPRTTRRRLEYVRNGNLLRT